MAPLDDILNRIMESTELSREEINDKISDKQKELSNLVSAEGAAHLVAKDLGVNLVNNERRKLELRNILPGMRNVNANGRIFRVSNVVNFKKKNGDEGKVVNIFIGDNTGFVRVTLWNEQVKIIEEHMLQIGDIVQVTGAFSKENIYGDVELSLGKFGRIFPITEEADAEGIDFPSAEQLDRVFSSPDKNRVPIKNISSGNFEIKAMIVDVIPGRFIFNTCSVCGAKMQFSDSRYSCPTHGEVEMKPEMVASFMADDGTGAMRVVAFRETAERMAGTTASELNKLNEDERRKIVSGSMLGKEYIISGNVKKNSRTDKMEMIVNSFKELDVSAESERIAELLKMKLE